MKTIKQVEVSAEFVLFIPTPKDMKENTIYISEEYKCAMHKCLCGCGELTVTPFDKDNWSLIKTENNKISLKPSIYNWQYKCKSHYIITGNIANFV